MPAAIEKEMEQAVQKAPASLPTASMAGALFIILSLVGLQYAVPMLWQASFGPAAGAAPSLLSNLGLVAVLGIALVALVWAYPRFVPQAEGSKAGVAATVLFLILGFLFVYVTCLAVDGLLALLTNRGMLGKDFYANRYWAGAVIAAALAFLWLRWGWQLLKDDKNQRRLRQIEEQGWFQAGAYKPNQGRLIRRLTMIGLMLLVAGGFVHFWPSIQRGMTGVWAWNMPFADDYRLVLAYMPGLTVATIIGLGSLWLAYRAVNAPRFADFLVSTSAEMQKVSWPTRPQLVRDTIVVLVVTVLLTAFLLSMDVLWVVVLRFFGVLKH